MTPEILESIYANFITTAILILISIIAYLLAIILIRRKYHAIFGLRRSMNRIGIYLSAVDVAAGSTFGTEPLTTGFTGLAVQRGELIAARNLETMLGSAPIPFHFQLLDYVLGKLFFSLSKVEVEIDVGHQGLKADPNKTLILIGTRIYNHLTFTLVREGKNNNQHERAIDPFFIYDRNEFGERAFIRNPARIRNMVKMQGYADPGREPGERLSDQLAIVERHWDESGGRVIFLICGVGSLATASAIRFVVEQYSACCQFQDRYGMAPYNDWAILLKIEDETDDLMGAKSFYQIPQATIQRLVSDRIEHDSSSRIHLKLDVVLKEMKMSLQGATK